MSLGQAWLEAGPRELAAGRAEPWGCLSGGCCGRTGLSSDSFLPGRAQGTTPGDMSEMLKCLGQEATRKGQEEALDPRKVASLCAVRIRPGGPVWMTAPPRACPRRGNPLWARRWTGH